MFKGLHNLSHNAGSSYSNMSFVDLATLTLHRQHELENRIHLLGNKCDHAIGDIKKLKMKANLLVSELNCEPSELKERFLSTMQKLEEYMYLITDFNLAIAQIAETDTEQTPVQDTFTVVPPVSLSPYNLIDALTEPRPSTSCPCPNLCPPQKPIRAKIPREDQQLIVFSSSSSAESVQRKDSVIKERSPMIKDGEKAARELQCNVNKMPSLVIEDSDHSPRPQSPFALEALKEQSNPPAQTILEVDHEYSAVIMHVDAAYLWVITEDTEQVTNFIQLMTDFYSTKKHETLSREMVCSMMYCAYKDDTEGNYYRAMFIKELKSDPSAVQLFLMDTGEMCVAPMSSVQALWPQFFTVPPFARLCHLAGIADLGNNIESEPIQKVEAFLKEYIGTSCTIKIDDNSSESLGVYVLLSANKYLNDIVVDLGFATPLEQPVREAISPKVVFGPPDDTGDEFVVDCPEYEDPVVAVTGYHNRDEADICKHYKGGPEKTCFKGTRCKKKHILKHPDGWTYDQVEVCGVPASVPLPAPGTWLKALVTCVPHFDRVFVQIQGDKTQEEVPKFGVVLPPKTLASLQRDMNSPATVMAYKHLTLTPAPGEMVAALYPMDGCWYRAKVLSITPADQNVEIMYVDYGTRLWVKENQIRLIEPRFASLPTQAVQCVLAGVSACSADSRQWAQATRALSDMVVDQLVEIHVIAREFDEVIVEMLDSSQFSVEEQLAGHGLVNLVEYEVTPDDDVTQKVVVPS